MRASIAFALLSFLCTAKAWAGCNINTTAVSFPAYSALSAGNDLGSGSLALSCDGPDTVVIALTAGGGGSFNPRAMTLAGGSSKLNYNLYSDSARTSIWGDGTTYPVVTIVYGNAPPPAIPVYAQIFAGQDVAPGKYMDTITVNYSF